MQDQPLIDIEAVYYINVCGLRHYLSWYCHREQANPGAATLQQFTI